MGSLEGRHLHASIEVRRLAKGQEPSYLEMKQNEIAAIEPLTMRHLDPSELFCGFVFQFFFHSFPLPFVGKTCWTGGNHLRESLNHRRSLLTKKTNNNNKSIP